MLSMGLAGILTVALIASADQSNAGAGGMRAVTAFVPAGEQDPAPQRPVPILTGVLDGLRDLPIFAPPPAPAGPATAPVPAAGPPAPPSPSVPPVSSGPSLVAPSATPAPIGTPTPIASEVPSANPAPPVIAAPFVTPAPSASPSPIPALALATDRGASAIVSLADLVPGDTIARTITVRNTGTLGFRYAVSVAQTASTPLWTDATDGLQLTVSTSLGVVLYRGPLSALGSLAGPATLAPGDSEQLRYAFTFPVSAPDAFQGLLQDLTLVFTATQYP